MASSLTTAALLLALLSLSSASWAAWNSNPIATAFNTLSLPQHPNLPYLWSRVPSGWSDRKNQYAFDFQGLCTMYCSPRSWLVESGSGRYLCQRDQHPNYWGSVSGHTEYCFPDYVGGICPFLAVNLQPKCSVPNGGAIECCYHNELYNPGEPVPDLVDQSVTTGLFALRNSE